MAKTPDPKYFLAVFSKNDNTVNLGDFVSDHRCKQSNKKYHDLITFLSVIINCLQANHFISILYEIKLGYKDTKCFNQELPVNFFLVRKIFSLPTDPEKS